MKRKKGFIHEKTRMSAKVREFNTPSFLRVPWWIDIFFIFLSAFIRVNLRLKVFSERINANEEEERIYPRKDTNERESKGI